MAPLPDAAASSFDRISSYVSTLSNHITRSLIPNHNSAQLQSSVLKPRGDPNFDPGAGVTPPTNIPNQAVFAVFGLIGAGFVLTGIWFFFWAKNGGFYFKEGDWEDYKSTVLRRKGPNGTTLSGATATTDLGGGSVVGRRQRMARYKDADIESSIGTQSEMSEIKAGRSSREKKNKAKKSKKRAESEGTRASDDQSVVSGALDEELLPDEVVRAYRHEKPAKVGGLNRAPDGSAFEGSTHDSHSELLSNRQATPKSTPTKKVRKDNYTGGSGSPSIRKVESTSGSHSSFWGSNSRARKEEKTTEREREERVKAEARKLQEKGRAASSRRDFSYTAGDDAATTISGSTADEERRARRESRRAKVPGSYADSSVGSELGSDAGTGTKSYHHPIPGLSDYAEERRRARERVGGYRRGD